MKVLAGILFYFLALTCFLAALAYGGPAVLDFMLGRLHPRTDLDVWAAWEEAHILSSVVYTPDEGPDSWALPEETRKRGRGDCEDMALLFLDDLYWTWGVEGKMVVMSYPSQAPGVRHAEVEVKGKRYFQPSGEKGLGTFVREYSRDEAMKIAENMSRAKK